MNMFVVIHPLFKVNNAVFWSDFRILFMNLTHASLLVSMFALVSPSV